MEDVSAGYHRHQPKRARSASGICLMDELEMRDENEKPGNGSAHLEAALGYLNRGWSLVPVIPHTKRPIIAWQSFQHRLPSKDEVEGWFDRWPTANLAVVTGAISGLVVIDIDPRHGGTESLAKMEARHGPLPETIEANTGGGGRHVYFAHPGHEVRNRVGLAPGIDLRGDGGCIIVPPSVHPCGKQYRWRPGHAPGEVALAPLPIWLELSKFRGESARGQPVAYWRELVRDGVQEGQRNATIASFAGHLLWHAVDPDVVMELLLAWNRVRCSPPLPDEEVIKTVRSIERMHSQHAATPTQQLPPDNF